jgi:hypothetical protein
MVIPKFVVKLDRELDQQCFIYFFEEKNPMIFEFYPNLKKVADIKQAIKDNYGNRKNEILKTKHYIEKQIPVLDKIATELSKIIECSWDDIDKITIIPSVCPVCPRFIDTNSFLVAYYFNPKSIIRICAHEMSHFLYFKKLKQVFPNQKIDTEYPSKDWLLSEIITPILINQRNLQKYINQKDEFYSPESNRHLSEQKIIKNLFIKSKGFTDFIKSSYQSVESTK